MAKERGHSKVNTITILSNEIIYSIVSDHPVQHIIKINGISVIFIITLQITILDQCRICVPDMYQIAGPV